MPLPFTPGMEGAGIVESVGERVIDWNPGDRVAWAMTTGSYAEYATLSGIQARPSARRRRHPHSSRGHDAAGHDGALSDALDVSAEAGRHCAGARGRGRSGTADYATRKECRRPRDRHGVDGREGQTRARCRRRRSHPLYGSRTSKPKRSGSPTAKASMWYTIPLESTTFEKSLELSSAARNAGPFRAIQRTCPAVRPKHTQPERLALSDAPQLSRTTC